MKLGHLGGTRSKPIALFPWQAFGLAHSVLLGIMPLEHDKVYFRSFSKVWYGFHAFEGDFVWKRGEDTCVAIDQLKQVVSDEYPV